jgi:hypothetical protein
MRRWLMVGKDKYTIKDFLVLWVSQKKKPSGPVWVGKHTNRHDYYQSQGEPK